MDVIAWQSFELAHYGVVSKLAERSWRRPENSFFNNYFTEV